MKTTPWQNGFTAGRTGKSLDVCPYFGVAEVWEWVCGYLDGRAKHMRLVTRHTVNPHKR
jgi:ribosome modulation factor